MVVNFGPGPDDGLKPGQTPYDFVGTDGGGAGSMGQGDFMVNDRSGASQFMVNDRSGGSN